MPDDPELAIVAALARRAGLSPDEADLANLLAADRRNRPLLDALRARLAPTDEPAITFDARHR